MKSEGEFELLTLAAVRRSEGGGSPRFLFNERERIFVLDEKDEASSRYERQLRLALEGETPVKAVLDPGQPVIRQVEPPTAREIEVFFKERTLLEEPDKVIRIEIDEIDPTTFNIVDYYLKIPTFLLCKRIVPGYSKAKEIFDFCAAQSCHLPGPYDVSPCIPFQFVIDGCYARAHKMRKIITEKYGYCCEKVFSFANVDDDTLAVRADKWGGCCVTWWYHVAPLIRMRVQLRRIKFPVKSRRWLSIDLAMVIDPGMFDKPVLLSTWLTAQQNAACSADAHVSNYSIQPGSAYAPANYDGTAFSTDPGYTQTDSILNAYSGLATCP
jgi:hypothetical protein